MTFDFNETQKGATSPLSSGFAITPNDSSDLGQYTRGLWIGGGGDISLILAEDSSAVEIKNIATGSLLPMVVKRVNATNTTASEIIGLN